MSKDWTKIRAKVKDFIENDFKPLVDVLTNIHLQEESA